jgi:hypothetical protein
MSLSTRNRPFIVTNHPEAHTFPNYTFNATQLFNSSHFSSDRKKKKKRKSFLHHKINMDREFPASQPLFVRALYDYEAAPGSSELDMRLGDVVQIITRHESGWWDAVSTKHGQKVRGWIPSNWVEVCAEPGPVSKL